MPYLCSRNFEDGVSAVLFQQSKTEHGSAHEMKDAYLYHRVSARRQLNTE